MGAMWRKVLTGGQYAHRALARPTLSVPAHAHHRMVAGPRHRLAALPHPSGASLNASWWLLPLNLLPPQPTQGPHPSQSWVLQTGLLWLSAC